MPNSKFLDIKSMMSAVDTRNKTWYQNLPEDQKKLYSPYMTMKWTASIEHQDPINAHVNVNVSVTMK